MLAAQVHARGGSRRASLAAHDLGVLALAALTERCASWLAARRRPPVATPADAADPTWASTNAGIERRRRGEQAVGVGDAGDERGDAVAVVDRRLARSSCVSGGTSQRTAFGVMAPRIDPTG